MHREIDRAVDQRLVDLLGEQPLAADVGERPVLHHVSGRADRAQFDSPGVEAVGGGKPRAHLARLRERKRTAARADAQRG